MNTRHSTLLISFLCSLWSGASFAQSVNGNIIFGDGAGASLSGSSGTLNVVLGNQAGNKLNTGSYNILLGNGAGNKLTSFSGNNILGDGAGLSLLGDNNTFLGRWTGMNMTTGNQNLMLGVGAGINHSTGSYNTYLGAFSGPAAGQGSLQYATAIGSYAKATTSNSIVLGATTDADNNPIAINVGIGTSAPSAKLHVVGDLRTTTGRFSSIYSQNTDGAYPSNVANAVGDAQLTIGANWTSGMTDLSLINSNIANTSGGGFSFWQMTGATSKKALAYLNGAGQLAIGTTYPIDYAQLHVHGTGGILSTGAGAQLRIRDIKSTRTTEPWLDEWAWYATDNVARFHRPGLGDVMAFSSLGNVGIGTITPGNYKLAVEGVVGAREVEVKTGAWADFVFAKGYSLPSLASVEAHIAANKHLPGIPSEKDVKRDGYALGAMDAKLLQKIEELTLYVIQQQKRIEQLEAQAAAGKARRARLKQ